MKRVCRAKARSRQEKTSPLIQEMKKSEKGMFRELCGGPSTATANPRNTFPGNEDNNGCWSLISLSSTKNRCGFSRGCTRPLKKPQQLPFFFATSRLRARHSSLLLVSSFSSLVVSSSLLVLLLSAAAYGQSAIDAATYQRVVDENLELRKQFFKLDVEANALRQKNASLLLDIQDLERRKNQLALLMSQIKTPEETAAEIARLQLEKQVLFQEVERLRRALEQVPPPVTNAPAPVTPESIPPAASVPAPGSDLFRKIEQENAELRHSLDQSRAAAQTEAATRDRLAQSESRLKEELARLADQVRQVTAEAESLRRKEAALKKALVTQARKAFEAEQKSEDRSQKSEVGGQKSEVGGQKSEVRDQKPESSIQPPASSIQTPQAAHSATQQPGNLTTVSSLLDAARKLLDAKRAREAEALYLKALKLEPKNPQVAYNLGVLYGDYLKNAGKAAKYYRRYLALAPNAPDAPQVRSWLAELDARSRW